MISLVLAVTCWFICLEVNADTLAAVSVAQAPVLDGGVTDHEYGTPALQFCDRNWRCSGLARASRRLLLLGRDDS